MSHDRPQSAGVQKEGDTGSSRQAMTCFTPGSKKNGVIATYHCHGVGKSSH